MADADATLAALRDHVSAFVQAREWERYHNPKDLAIALSVEASELLERFLWRQTPAGGRLSAEDRDGIAEELADVFIYGLSLCNALRLDASEAILAKLAKDEAKYPVERFKGRARAKGAGDPP